MGVVVLAVLLASANDSLPSVSEPKPLGIARLILETSAYGAVVKGLLIGLSVPLVGFVAIYYTFRNSDRWSAPLSTGFIGLVLIALFLAALNAPSTVVVAGSLVVKQEDPGPAAPPPIFTPLRPTLTPSPTAGDSPMPPNFKVAFIGDQGLGNGSVAVLRLIRDEGADMVLHQGDFDYLDKPAVWDLVITGVLGPDFPYFASVGNHDTGRWEEYQRLLLDRLARIPDASCIGDLGVKSACWYKGLFFILSGAGTMDYAHESYIRDQLIKDDSIWRICSWHKNQGQLQTGHKDDAVGWKPYEECRKGGAIIATGHDHGYSRTYLMDHFETQSIVSDSNRLKLEKGKTFVFVSGLGGKNVSDESHEAAERPWWAAVYNSTHDANFGALFCNFNENGVKNRAHCYFKDIDGRTPDNFYLESHLGGSALGP